LPLRGRRRRPVSLQRWTVVVLAAAILIPLVLFRPDGLGATGLVTPANCRAVLDLGLPLLGDQTGAPTSEAEGSRVPAPARDPVAWLFSALTGISVGEPASFLSAHLPLARTSYAAAILASGRAAEPGWPAGGSPGSGGGTWSGAAPGDLQGGTGGGPGGGAGGGLSPGKPAGSGGGVGPTPETGVPEGARTANVSAGLYLYGPGDPLVGIVHTHGSESFLPVLAAMTSGRDTGADPADLEPFSTDTSVNMIRIGHELARYLSLSHGIGVVHSRRLHDRKEDGFRLGAYERSLETMTAILRSYPTVEILLDLHRDAPGHDKTTVVIDGVPMAKVYVILGTDRYLDHPNWEKNYAFARRLVAVLEQNCPGLSRGILVQDYRYNQHVMERTLLIELGGQGNTLAEVLATVRVLGDVLAQLLAEGLE